MAESKVKPEKPGKDEKPAETFEYEFVLQAIPAVGAVRNRDCLPDPGPDTAAVFAAMHAGYRPVGESRLSGPKLHADGVSLVYSWSVPVVKVKA